jgi:hypothetical protein
MSSPNLFTYATSELSQDAFLCWLLAWADPACAESDPALHTMGTAFVGALFRKANVEPPTIHKVEVQRQFQSIDIVAKINDTHLVAIEDKVNTVEHSDQLRRYKQLIEDKFPHLKRALVYLKAGDQSSYRSVIKDGWHTFSRKELLQILSLGEGKTGNAIFLDFKRHLAVIDQEVEAYKEYIPSTWEDRQWVGFYSALQNDLPDAAWSYVSNPSGGFMGFWWGWVGITNGQLYLQLEQEKLVIKVEVPREEHRKAVRDAWSTSVIRQVSEPRLRRPARLGNGKWMTVAVCDTYLQTRPDGMLDYAKTLDFLQKATQAVATLQTKAV